jgi:hypothetical protein
VVAPLAPLAVLAQQDDPTLFLGEDFLPWMVLAFGAAMVVGNVVALLRPPGAQQRPADGSGATGPPAARPPLVRSVVMIGIGLVAAVWGAASLLS